MSWKPQQREAAGRRRASKPRGRTLTLSLLLSLAVVAAGAGTAGAAVSARISRASATGSQVLAWGDNDNGQLGDGTTTSSDTPVRVSMPSGTTVTKLVAGGNHSLALTAAGQVLAWGDNRSGQLGDGNTTDSHVPVPVDLPEGVVVTAVAAGADDSLALTSAGQVLSWGDNFYGQLGDGSTIARSEPGPVRLPRGTRVVAVAASYNYSLALTTAGHVLAWGYNGSGQLGDGVLTASEIPVRVKLPRGTRVRAIAAGGFDGLVLTTAGRVLAWGDDEYGQLGDGAMRNSDVPVAVRLPAGASVVELGVGSEHDLALTSSGQVLAWGYNAYGQLGNRSVASSDVPVTVRIPQGDQIAAISAGGGFSLALTAAGQILAWGHNEFGQLGDGTMTRSEVPVQVKIPTGLSASALAVGPTTRHSLTIAG